MRNKNLPQKPSRNKTVIRLTLWALICLYIVFFGLVSFLKYRSFGYGDFDLAIHSQTLWNILHGSIYSSILGINFLGNHAHFILFLIAPLYLLFQSPLTLLFLQTLSLGLTAYPLYLIAKEKLNERMALTVAFIYLIYPALGYVNLFEFHPTVFATLFLTLMFYYFIKGAFGKFALFMFLALLCQENIPLIIIPVGIYAIFAKKGIKWSAVPILAGGAWFWITVGKVIPYFNKDTVQFFNLYSHMGTSIPEIAGFIITHPLGVAKIIAARQNMIFLINLFMPLCFFSLFDAQILIIFPILLQHMLSTRGWEHTIYRHYTAEMIPIIFIPAIYGIKRFLEIPYIRKHLRQGVFISVVLLTAVISNICYGPAPGLIVGHNKYIRDIWDCQKERFIAMVPEDTGVVATFEFLPRLSHRKNLYSFHHIVHGFYTISDKPYLLPPETEYALLDFNDTLTFDRFNPYFTIVDSYYKPGKSDINLRNFLKNDNWGVVDMVGSIVLLKKNYKSKYSLYQVSDRLPEVSNPIPATVEGELELIGLDVGSKDDDKNQIELSFFWRALKEIKKDYGSFIDIVDKDGKQRYRFIIPICYRIYPCYIWQRQKIVRQGYRLILPQDVKDGYSVKMGIFDYKNKRTYQFSSSVPDAVDDNGRVNLRI